MDNFENEMFSPIIFPRIGQTALRCNAKLIAEFEDNVTYDKYYIYETSPDTKSCRYVLYNDYENSTRIRGTLSNVEFFKTAQDFIDYQESNGLLYKAGNAIASDLARRGMVRVEDIE